MRLNRMPDPTPPAFQIGTYDESALFDLSDKVTVNKQKSFASQAEALSFAQNNAGAEMIVESRSDTGKLGYDVYSVTIHDKGQSLQSGQQMKNLTLFDQPLKVIAQNTGETTQRAFFVTADGKPQANIYSPQFDRSTYDKLRGALDLDNSKQWFKLVDKYMTAPSPADDLAPINNAEIQDMKARLKPGDIIMTGNNGSFIHAIVYVGNDPALQQQLEKKWNLPAGTLNGEGMILHSLAADHEAEITLNGKTFKQPAGGVGVIIDTIERYNARNPRDTMISIAVKGATEADRAAVIAEGKKMVGKGYDNGFNTFDDNDIYCTEFVYKAWLAAPDTAPGFSTQRHPLVPQTSAPVSGWLYDKMPEKTQTLMKDDGYLYQELIMTDGMITNPNVEITWANQNAEKSEFFAKHERWADGMDGKISAGYKDLLQENIPEQASRSHTILEQVRAQSSQTRERLGKE